MHGPMIACNHGADVVLQPADVDGHLLFLAIDFSALENCLVLSLSVQALDHCVTLVYVAKIIESLTNLSPLCKYEVDVEWSPSNALFHRGLTLHLTWCRIALPLDRPGILASG